MNIVKMKSLHFCIMISDIESILKSKNVSSGSDEVQYVYFEWEMYWKVEELCILGKVTFRIVNDSQRVL